ncbi:MAG: biosynthetic peptidoglycan transglycosylase [Gemmatimonadales bacterium]
MRPLRRLLAAAAALLAVFLLWLSFIWPPPSWWRTHWPARTAFMAMRERQLDAAGRSGAQLYDPVPADSMSPWLARAAIAGEDQAFYSHHGIDYRALREAIGYRRGSFAWGNARDRAELARALALAWKHRDRVRGASTITQQLAKNLYLSPSRNPLRKLKEAVVAYRLEAALDKPRILELYLNVAEFGPELWGAGAASRHYFGVPPSRLSIAQAALLAATLPRPLTSNPSFRPGYALARQQLILLKLGGQPVVIPPADVEDTLPLPPILPDSTILRALAAPYDSASARDTAPASRPGAAPRKDSAAASPKPDAAAAPPIRKPAPA